jgi:hypothetical protein
VNRKAQSHRLMWPSTSPLLRALTYSRTSHGPVTRSMLLQCYTALDAFCRGHGSRELFATLGRYLLVAEELCRPELQADDADLIEAAQQIMVELDAAQKAGGTWTLDDDGYSALCAALDILAVQLADASLEDITRAESAMVTGLLKAHGMRAPASGLRH